MTKLHEESKSVANVVLFQFHFSSNQVYFSVLQTLPVSLTHLKSCEVPLNISCGGPRDFL